jgi:hypothetical protein
MLEEVIEVFLLFLLSFYYILMGLSIMKVDGGGGRCVLYCRAWVYVYTIGLTRHGGTGSFMFFILLFFFFFFFFFCFFFFVFFFLFW